MYQPSFWERETVFSNIDVCIIGSGIVGLNAALHIKSISPKLNVMVVDSGFLPYGASTRNAGFACFGSMTELLDDTTKESESEVFQRVELRWKGLQKLRSVLGDKAIEYEHLGGYEVFTKKDEISFHQCLNKIEVFNKLLKPITGIDETYKLSNHRIKEFGFAKVDNLILNTGEGQINTGKMMDALEHQARRKDIRIINGMRISEINNRNSVVELYEHTGFRFYAKKCLVANNGFVANILPDLEVKPARAQVLITKPVKNLPFRGSFHYEQGYYYFRNVGDRVLFGGGRNLDFEGENTIKFGTTTMIQDRLNDLLSNVILPNHQFEVDLRWSGIMGLGPSKSTILKKVEGNIYCAVRMGGMGVAIGSLIGEQAAEMVVGSI